MDSVTISWLGVLLAAVAAFALNMFWFSEKVFYTRWLAALGRPMPSREDAEGVGMGVAFGSVTAALFVQAFMVDWLLQAITSLYDIRDLSLLGGLVAGAIIGAGIAAATSLGHRVFAGQGFKVWAIEVGADVIGLGLMGAVLSFWH